MRSYSLSSGPGAGYRISVKHEPHGAASGYLTTRLRPGAILDAAAPRGDFVLDGGRGPVLLVSAGIGVTPVLAMLHDLAARHSSREIWWIHGARSPQEQPLAAEAHALLASLPHAREHVFYSAAPPPPRRRTHVTAGRLSKDRLAGLGLPASATAYVCGPASFMADMRQALAAVGINPANIHNELFGALPPVNPGLAGQTREPPHQRRPAGNGAAGDLRPQRPRHPVPHRPAQRPGPGRGLCHSHPVELPDRRLPHLRDAAAVRSGALPPGPA